MSARIFISHSTADRVYVQEHLLSLLDALGLEYWFAETNILPSADWDREILAALNRSKWFLLVMSQSAAQSKSVRSELRWAFEHIPNQIIPIKIAACKADDFDFRLSSTQEIDFQPNITKAKERLIKLLIQREYLSPDLRGIWEATWNEKDDLGETRSRCEEIVIDVQEGPRFYGTINTPGFPDLPCAFEGVLHRDRFLLASWYPTGKTAPLIQDFGCYILEAQRDGSFKGLAVGFFCYGSEPRTIVEILMKRK
jgi:hypothetical protein